MARHTVENNFKGVSRKTRLNFKTQKWNLLNCQHTHYILLTILTNMGYPKFIFFNEKEKISET